MIRIMVDIVSKANKMYVIEYYSTVRILCLPMCQGERINCNLLREHEYRAGLVIVLYCTVD